MAKANNQVLAVERLKNLLTISCNSLKVFNIIEQEWKKSINKDKTGNIPHTGQLKKMTYAESIDAIRLRENGITKF